MRDERLLFALRKTGRLSYTSATASSTRYMVMLTNFFADKNGMMHMSRKIPGGFGRTTAKELANNNRKHAYEVGPDGDVEFINFL